MSDLFWKRLNLISAWLVVACLFGALVFTATIEIKDTDLWLHLGMGQFIVENGYVPDVDVLSSTVAGQPWINHEWLFQIIVHSVHQAGGPDALIKMQVVLVVLTFLLLLLLGYNKNKLFPLIILLYLVLVVYRDRFTVRPDLFSLLFFASYIYLLFFKIKHKWTAFVLFLIQLVWSNIHGFFFLGPLLILINLAGEWLKRRGGLPFHWGSIKRLGDQEYTHLQQALGLAVIACILNPMGLQGAWYPIGILFDVFGKSNIFFSHILELQRPIGGWGNLFTASYLEYKLLLLFSFLTFLFNYKRIDIRFVLIWFFFLFFSLSAIRNLIYFAFFAMFSCMTNLKDFNLKDLTGMEFSNRRAPVVILIICQFIFIGVVLQYVQKLSFNGYFNFDTLTRKSEFWGVSLRNYPYKAADFLVENNIKGNFFNDFNSGAYLVGRTFPNIKVFIDGRTELYGSEFFEQHRKMWKGDTQLLENAFVEYDITGALLNSVYVPVPRRTLEYFYENKDWVLVYFDYDAVIFLRDIPENREAIDRFTVDVANWKTKKLDLLKVGTVPITPYQHVNRAYSLTSMKQYDAALAELQEAITILPGYKDPYKIRGYIHLKREEYMEAFENFRAAKIYDSYDVDVRYNLAFLYEHFGDYQNAVNQCNLCLQFKAGEFRCLILLAKTYAKNGQLDQALAVLKSTSTFTSDHLEEIITIADIFFEHKDYQSARKVYSIAAALKKDSAELYNKVGVCFSLLGDKDAAKQEFEKALEISPGDAEIKKNLKNLMRDI